MFTLIYFGIGIVMAIGSLITLKKNGSGVKFQLDRSVFSGLSVPQFALILFVTILLFWPMVVLAAII